MEDGAAIRPGMTVCGAVLALDPPPPRRPGLADAAVLVPIVDVFAPFILLTRRSTALRHHPGQVSFPGGRVDAGDRDYVDAALREAAEEIGLDRARVRIAGALPPVRTSSGFAVFPIVGLVDGGARWFAAPAEVDAVVQLPVAVLLDPTAPRVESVGTEGRPTWVWPHPTERIWGATAAILKVLAGRLHAPPPPLGRPA